MQAVAILKQSSSSFLTDAFTNLESQNPSIDELYVTCKRRSADFEAKQLRKGWSGRDLGLCVRIMDWFSAIAQIFDVCLSYYIHPAGKQDIKISQMEKRERQRERKI